MTESDSEDFKTNLRAFLSENIIIPCDLVKGMLDKYSQLDVWEIYYAGINIPFTYQETDSSLVNALKNPVNAKALEHIALFLISSSIEDEILLKQAIRLSLKDKDSVSQVKKIIKNNQKIRGLIISILNEDFIDINTEDFKDKDKIRSSVKQLVELLSNLDDQGLSETILSKVDSCGRNILMRAYEYQSSAVTDLLAIIIKFDEEQQKQILDKTDRWQNTVLSWAIIKYPSEVPHLLIAIKNIAHCNFIKQILEKTNDNNFNALMSAVKYQPSAVPLLLEAIEETRDLEVKKNILGKTNDNGNSALMLAALYQPSAVEALLRVITSVEDNHWKNDLLSKPNRLGYNALMLAVEYQLSAVPLLLGAINQTVALDSRQEIFAQKSEKGENVLGLALKYWPAAVPELLNEIQKFTLQAQTSIIADAVISAKKNELENHLTPCLKNIFKRHIDEKIYSSECKIQAIDPFFNVIQTSYHLYGTLKKLSSEKQAIEVWGKLIAYLTTNKTPEAYFEILEQYRVIAENFKSNDKTIKELLCDLQKHLIDSQIQNIKWPEEEPFSRISDKKNIQSILDTLRPEWLVKKTSSFKPVYNTFPEDWKTKYLHQCRLHLVSSDYNRIVEELISNDDNMPSAKKFVAQVHGSINLLDYVEPSAPPEPAPPQLSADFWTNVDVRNKAEFIAQLQGLADIDTTYEFISYMRRKTHVMDFTKFNTMRNWIQEDEKIRRIFHLHELTYFAKHYQNLADNIVDVNSIKKTELLYLAIQLKNLQRGLMYIYAYQDKELTYNDRLKSFEMHGKFMSDFTPSFERFKKKYPGVMDFTSSLQHPNYTCAHTLVELAPIRPLPLIHTCTDDKQNNSAHGSLTEQLLINNLKQADANIAEKIKQTKDPKFFRAIENKSQKNLLLLALETKNNEKIHAVTEAIYNLGDDDRKFILQTCNKKGYRFTSYTREKDRYLFLLELERIACKIEEFDATDPNIKILNALSLRLRHEPQNFSTDIADTKIQLRKNISWRQWFWGKYSKTDYGIGILKETMDSLLDKIEIAMNKKLNSQKK